MKVRLVTNLEKETKLKLKMMAVEEEKDMNEILEEIILRKHEEKVK